MRANAFHEGPSVARISGTVASVVGNHFKLDDGTREVIVDAGPRWWQQIDLSLGERVTVEGEPGRWEFDAFTIIRADGSVIRIRPGPGRPPWAGGKR